MIRILHIVTYMGLGGLETMLMNYYRHMPRDRIQFDFLVHREFNADYDKEILSLGGKIYHFQRLIPWSRRYRRQLTAFLGSHPEYRIIHVHQDCFSAVALECAKQCRIPVRITDSNLNHTGIYLYSKGKIMIHLTFDYKTDEKCTTPGQYLKYHRTFQGFTTRELAEKVGIVPATLVLYENDRHPIKHSTAVALANALGIDRNRLLDKYTAFVDYPYSSLLKKVRQELSLTQMQMAEVIGIGQTSYSGWEREIRVPRRKEYEKILAALKKLKVNVDTYLCHPAST